ncbi:MAG: hypothetical protein H0X62_15035, partial [Bacteroidetes bacterium]|nr:hypothetical protein [Bacteroidota bacterium]
NLTNSMNLSAIGMHEISATVNAAWDEISFNNNTIETFIIDSVYAIVSSDSVCSGNDANLALAGSAANIQWQVNDGNGFVNITGANQATTSYAVTSNMEFRATYCNNKTSDTVSVVEINLLPPVTQNDTVCFDNPATLSATGSGSMNWYTAATGGNSIHSGSTYTTTVPATTTFYVEASTSGTGGSDTLLTTTQAGNGCGGGSMFNITAVSGAITVTGFDVSLTGQVSQTVNVYYRNGGFAGFETNAAAWTLVGAYPITATSVAGGTLTFVNSADFVIPQGLTYGIYIEANNHYTTGTAPGTTYTDANIEVFAGVGLCSSFGGLNNPRLFNGSIHYQSGCTSPSRTPVEAVILPVPAISLSASVAICQGDSITLDPGTITGTYLWSTNDITQTIAATTAGMHKVTATGTNGCSVSDSTNVIVNALPTVTAISSDPEVCDGNQVTLTGSGTGAGTLTYTWDQSVTNQLPFTPTSTEIYTLTGVDANNCENTDTVTVIVNPLPVVIGTATSPEVCIGDSVTLTGSGASTLIWDNNVDDAVPFAPSTTEIYTVTGTDANNCTSTDSVTVVVNLLPIVEANVSASAVCEGEQVTLTGSGADAYTWDNNVIDNVPFVPVTTLSYIVTGVDTNNCTNTDQITVTVNPLPIVIANATATAVCFGDDVTLSGSGADSYFWSNGVTDSVAFNPNATLSYEVTGTDANNCSNTDEITITVNPLPDVTLENFEVACLNFPEFNLSGGNPAPGTYLLGGTDPAITFNPSDFSVGFHAITYTHTDGNGCTSSAQGLIEVSECVGIAETAFGAGSVKVYPNP